MAVLTVDQIISGASNVLIALLAAHLLPAAQFGLFGITFILYTILVGVSRGLVSDPLLLHPVEAEERSSEVIGSACVVAVPLGCLLLAIGFGVRTWNRDLGDALIVLAICLPLLVLQDVGRYIGIATRRPGQAVVLDTVWLVVMLAAVAPLFATGTHELPWFIAAWGGSGAVAGLLVFRRQRLRDLQFGLGWLRQTWPLSWKFLVTYISFQGGSLGMASEVGAEAGARALGGVQGAVLLVRPFTTFQVAAMSAGIGDVARLAKEAQPVRRHVLMLTGVIAAVALLNMLGMLVLPNRLGHLLLGASWHPAQPLLLPTGMQIVFLALLSGPQAALLGVRAMDKAMALNVATTVMLLIGTFVGALIDGALGALWLAAAAQGLAMVASWITLWMHTRTSAPTAAASPGIVLSPVTPASAPTAAGSPGVVLSPVTLSPPPVT